MTTITMSQREIDRYDTINRLIRKELNGTEAAMLLKLSTRHVRRLKAKVKENKARGLIHGNRGRPSNHRISEKEREKISALIYKDYSDFKPGLATEKLEEKHGIKRDPKTIRKIMIEEGLWKPKKAKAGQKHRSWRKRKEYFGEMQQFDGSYHNWFEDRAEKCCLLASIDDAAGKVTKAKFDIHEGVFPVFNFWKEYIEKNGKPRSIYLDKFSTYKMNRKFAEENHDLKTQFERAMEEMDIDPITAHSPEAKGRIERLFETLQDRLIKEMRLEKINTIEEANCFLEEKFIPKFNGKYSIEPAKGGNFHKVISKKEKKELDSIFSRQYERRVNNDFTISFKKTWFQLIKDQPVTVCRKDRVKVEERTTGEICIRFRKNYLNYKILPERSKKKREQPWVLAGTAEGIRKEKKAYKPAPNHPWRRYHLNLTKNHAY